MQVCLSFGVRPSSRGTLQLTSRIQSTGLNVGCYDQYRSVLSQGWSNCKVYEMQVSYQVNARGGVPVSATWFLVKDDERCCVDYTEHSTVSQQIAKAKSLEYQHFGQVRRAVHAFGICQRRVRSIDKQANVTLTWVLNSRKQRKVLHARLTELSLESHSLAIPTTLNFGPFIIKVWVSSACSMYHGALSLLTHLSEHIVFAIALLYSLV